MRGDYKSVLHQMTQTTPTVLWNDSCAIGELVTSMEACGAVGATCNPVIVLEVLKKEWDLWKHRLPALIDEMPGATDEEVAWRLTEEMSVKAAALLKPIFDREKGRNGRLSIQTNPKFWRDAKRMITQAEHFDGLAENMIVKIPVTRAGIQAIEEVTYRGVSVNATVSFTLAQAIAVAEAVERGLSRREKEGKDISRMGPVCTLMVGRLDDWLKTVVEKENIAADPGVCEWAGVAVMKKAYRIYRQRGYRLRLLSAAFRNHMHWSQFIGGDVVISPPFKWQQKYNAGTVTVENRMDIPVEPRILSELESRFGEFRKAFEEKGLPAAEFDSYGATLRTLRQFCKATEDLAALVRDTMVPNPG